MLRRFGTTAIRATGPMQAAIHARLTATLEPTLVLVTNDSAAHAGHSAMRAQGGGNGETHFSVHVVSPLFANQRQLARHRLINNALKEQFDQGLHALVIKSQTPEEYEATK